MGPEADTGCEEGEGLSGSHTDQGSPKRHECRAHPGGEGSLLRGSSLEGREGTRNWWMRLSEGSALREDQENEVLEARGEKWSRI